MGAWPGHAPWPLGGPGGFGSFMKADGFRQMPQPPAGLAQLEVEPKVLPEEPPLKPNTETSRSTLLVLQLGQVISVWPELVRTSFSNFSPHWEHLYS